MKNVNLDKIGGFVRCVQANVAHMSLDDAIDLARKLGQETMDSAQLIEGERQARLLCK